MRNDLDHLPADRQKELQHIVRVLFEEFEDTIARTTDPKRKKGRILKVILYGSFARGDWVDDPVGGYKSDYDILVVVNDERLTDFEYWAPAEDRLARDFKITHNLSAQVGLVVHALVDVNGQIHKGRPFFVDIAAHGRYLYEADGHSFSSPGLLQISERLFEARQHFNRWFPTAISSIETARWQMGQPDTATWHRKAVFEMHQAVEQLYHCVLLTLTLYSPKSHKLNFLRGSAEDIAPLLVDAWPRAGRFERRCFELLRLAYVNARYSSEYSVSATELLWICERIRILQGLVWEICEDRMVKLEEDLLKEAQ